MKLKPIISLVTMLLAPAAHGDLPDNFASLSGVDGYDLARLAGITDETNREDYAEYVGYVHGVSDATVGEKWCPKDPSVPGTSAVAFMHVHLFLRISPELLHLTGADLVLAALSDVFPCDAK